MRLNIPLIAIFTLCFSSTTFGQQAKLEGIVYEIVNYKESPVGGVKVIAAGGQSQETNAKGHFIINFPNSVKPGQATRLEVNRPGWLVSEPLFGECTTKDPARNFELLKVIIVPKGSLLVLESKQLSKVIARWADERAKLLRRASTLERELDEYTFLRQYGEKYGITLEQFKAAADEWAKIKESDDKEERALKEYWRKNYDSAALLAHEAALNADNEYERNRQRMLESGRKVIRRFRLEGNAWYAGNKFREAVRAYNEIEARFEGKKLAKDEFLEEWVLTKGLLGNAKSELGIRVVGQESRLLLAEAVSAYREILKVYTPEKFPRLWAMTQSNLGIALISQGERAEGVEGARLLGEAVIIFSEALIIFTSEMFPQDWAMTQNNLGIALQLQGERAQGVEKGRLLAKAVAAYREALRGRRRETFPRDWAITQNNLGNALRLQGDQAEGAEETRLLAEAVSTYREALKVYVSEQLPQQRATTLNNLGIALHSQGERTEGKDGTQLLVEAVTSFREALKVYADEKVPQMLAATQNNLGAALKTLGERTKGAEGGRLLVEAVAADRAALKVFTREEFPQDWANAQNNLGNALLRLGEQAKGPEGVTFLSEAAQAHREALKIYTLEHFPQLWATVQNNLGNALARQGEGTKGAENKQLLREAVTAYLEALKGCNASQPTYLWAIVQHNLGYVYSLLGDWKNTVICYENFLSLSLIDRQSYSILALIYHEQLFEYAKAFDLHQRWLSLFPQDASILPDFAETHFTTGRFDECEKRITELLADSKLPASTKGALRAIEIADLLALGQAKQIPAKLEALLAEVSQQPATFKVEWSFNGTRHFIGQNEKVSAYRDWLGSLFDALTSKDCETILSSLREVQKNFR